MASHALTIGFDLDMTLIDSRPGIKAAFQALSAETGVHIDADLAITRLGPPLELELAQWFPEDRVEAVADHYRRVIYPAHAIAPTEAMPGAAAAVDAVRRLGGRAIVVTAKSMVGATMHLTHLGIAADTVVGQLWAEEKAAALREHGAAVFVGDHLGDVRGAHAAGAVAVAVPTGPISAAELRSAGADVVLPDLTAFPDWLARFAATRGEVVAATAADAGDIAALRDGLSQWMVDNGIDQWQPGEHPAAQIADEAVAGEWHVLRAEDGGLAAAVRLIWRDADFWGEDTAAGYIHGLMVSPKYRGVDLGARLLDFCAERTRAEGLTVQRLDCAAENPVLRKYYAARGFTEVRETELPPQYGRSLRMMLFEKRI